MKILNLAANEVILRAQQRGYDLEFIKGCIVKSLPNGRWLVDIDHPNYPRDKNKPYVQNIEPVKPVPQPPPVLEGPGTELKKLLGKIGITAKPNCSCNARANTMNQKGIEWCEQNIDEIVGWLKEEATKRKLPFIDYAGKLLVKRAISNARKNASK